MPIGRTILASALAGGASGLRSQMGIAVALRHIGADPRLRRATLVAAAGELVADKLPATPARIAPGPLAARVVLGALSAGLLARTRSGRPVALAAVVGGAGAAAAAHAGYRLRSAGPAGGLPSLGVAVAEDAAAVGIALGAAAA